MKKTRNAIAAIVTSNYIPQALAMHSYVKESNPGVSCIVVIVGEATITSEEMPRGPEWMWWDSIIPDRNRRLELATEYTPFELSCVVRGRLHYFLATQSEFDKWIVLDTDVGVLSSLNPIWDVLDKASIALIAHSTYPVSTEEVVPHEVNFLKCGLYNAGVVGMRHSRAAECASHWLCERLEQYGHAYEHRKAMALPSCYDFEFVDQLWLNLVPLYFKDAVIIIDNPVCNLGHWNLHEGNLELRKEQAYFNNQRVVVAHFSGLPTKGLETVSAFSKLYLVKTSDAWAYLATEYQQRLADATMKLPRIPYSYIDIQPQSTTENSRKEIEAGMDRGTRPANKHDIIQCLLTITIKAAKVLKRTIERCKSS